MVENLLMKAKLSVIIPVYNTEKYIGRCLNSIINQSLLDLEIIVVNDASPDNSDSVIQSYLNDKRIKYFKLNQNYGLGHARNVGLNIATGEYITFIDSDDWIDLDAYHNMVASIERNDADIAICGIKNEYSNSSLSTIRHNYSIENVISSEMALSLLCKTVSNNYYISSVVWNKIYRSSLIDKLKFLDNSFWEDDIFTFIVLTLARNVVLVPGIHCHYFNRTNSITRDISKKHIDDLIDSFVYLKNELEERYELFRPHYEALLDKCMCFVANMIFYNEPDVSIQKTYFMYLFNRFLSDFSLSDVIKYIDNKRIMRLFT